MTEVTYERPVTATLFVRLANGEEFEATPDDAAKFGYISTEQLFGDIRALVKAAVGTDPKESAFAPFWNVLCIAAYNREALHNEAMVPSTEELRALSAEIMAARASRLEF